MSCFLKIMCCLNFSDTKNFKSKKEINHLHNSGIKMSSCCINLIYQEVFEKNGFFKVAFVVPKRLFKKAVDRNLLRRRMKEAYKMNKSILLGGFGNKRFQFLFIYNKEGKKSYRDINESILELFKRLV